MRASTCRIGTSLVFVVLSLLVAAAPSVIGAREAADC